MLRVRSWISCVRQLPGSVPGRLTSAPQYFVFIFIRVLVHQNFALLVEGQKVGSQHGFFVVVASQGLSPGGLRRPTCQTVILEHLHTQGCMSPPWPPANLSDRGSWNISGIRFVNIAVVYSLGDPFSGSQQKRR